MNLRILPLVAAVVVWLPTSCQQVQESPQPSYAEVWQCRQMGTHHTMVVTMFAEFQNALKRAHHAEFSRVRGDCCCTGADLEPIKTVKPGKAEFAELMEILAQAQTPPTVDADVLAPLSMAPKEGEFDYANMVVMPQLNHICDALRLYDAENTCIYELELYNSIAKESSAPAIRRTNRHGDTQLIMLPDAMVDKFLRLPSYQKFVKRRADIFKKQTEPQMRKDVAAGHATEEDIEKCRPSVSDILFETK